MDLDFWDCFGRKKNSVLKPKKYSNRESKGQHKFAALQFDDDYYIMIFGNLNLKERNLPFAFLTPFSVLESY